MRLRLAAPLALVLQLAFSATSEIDGWPHRASGEPAPSSLRVARVRATAVVSGTVYDSIVGAPIAGASVQFAAMDESTPGRIFAARSDESGRYEIRDLPPGRYLAGFEHIALDSLGIENPARSVEVRDGNQRIPLATPSPRSIAAAICGPETGDARTTLLIGHVRETDTEMAIAGATVSVEWSETVLDESGFNTITRLVQAVTVGPGWFATCGLPSDAVLTTRAAHGADSTGFVEVQIPIGELRHLTYLIGGGRLVTVAYVDSVAGVDSMASIARLAWRGNARLTGTVRDREGRAVASARASVWGTFRETATNERGTFVLDSLPGGTQTLEVRLLGYVPVRAVVHLAEGRPASVDVVVADRATVLAAVETRGELVYSRNLQDFERRMRSGWGQYLTPAELARMPNVRLASLLQQVHGVRVVCFRGECSVTMRRPATHGADGYEYCEPTLYVDGLRDMVGDYQFLQKDQIAAIEVYGEVGRPQEFRDLNPCGAVVVWTRPRPARVRR